ncbi:hypothetical protein B0H14DRAFT_2916878 [Mycena olivaceomarginata]|nr:hypothetical protein B0H14DRAFT_2916878 [Mycena olivaceomarginata]
MSHKYDAEALRKRALLHLSQAHPTTLEAWDALPELPWSSGLSLDIVSVARQLDAEWILPTSFYRICQSSFDHEIATGTELGDADKVTCIRGCAIWRPPALRACWTFCWCPMAGAPSAPNAWKHGRTCAARWRLRGSTTRSVSQRCRSRCTPRTPPTCASGACLT